MIRKHFKTINKTILQLTTAMEDKLPGQDIEKITEMLENNEFGLALDILCTQIYEYDIKVDEQFYEDVKKVAEMMNIAKDSWEFIEEQVL